MMRFPVPPDKRIHAILLLCILGLLVYSVFSIISASFTLFDSETVYGFLALKNWEHGGGFNILQSAEPLNVLQTKTEFLTRRAPGQYLLPWFFQRTFGFSFVGSIKAVVISGLILFVPGVILSFRYLKLPLKVSLICVLICLLQRMILINTWGYEGDFLMICILPFYLLGFLLIVDLPNYAVRLILFFLLTILGGFVNLMFMPLSLALLLYLFRSRSDQAKNGMEKQSSFFSSVHGSAFFGIIAAWIFVYLFFFSKGSALQSLNGIHFRLRELSNLLLMPFSIFSFSEFSGYLSGKSFWLALPLNLLLFSALIGFVRLIYIYPNSKLKNLIIASSAVFFLDALYSISFTSDYHAETILRPVSFLCLPIIISYLITAKRNISFFVLSLLILAGSLYSVYSVHQLKQETNSDTLTGIRGFDYHTQTEAPVTAEMLTILTRLDARNDQSVFITDNLLWALDMKNSRYGMISNEFLVKGFSVPPPAYPPVYLLLKTSTFEQSVISKNKSYRLEPIMQSGDHILMRITTQSR